VALSSASWAALFHGRRPVYTLLFTFRAVLLLARTLQGLGSGLLVAIAYNMVSELYADILRARVLIARAVLAILARRLVWLHQRRQHGTSMQNVRAEY